MAYQHIQHRDQNRQGCLKVSSWRLRLPSKGAEADMDGRMISESLPGQGTPGQSVHCRMSSGLVGVCALQGGSHADARLRRAARQEAGESEEESGDESDADAAASPGSPVRDSADEEEALEADRKRAQLAAMLSLGPEELARLDEDTRAAIEELRAQPESLTSSPPVSSVPLAGLMQLRACLQAAICFYSSSRDVNWLAGTSLVHPANLLPWPVDSKNSVFGTDLCGTLGRPEERHNQHNLNRHPDTCCR